MRSTNYFDLTFFFSSCSPLVPPGELLPGLPGRLLCCCCCCCFPLARMTSSLLTGCESRLDMIIPEEELLLLWLEVSSFRIWDDSILMLELERPTSEVLEKRKKYIKCYSYAPSKTVFINFVDLSSWSQYSLAIYDILSRHQTQETTKVQTYDLKVSAKQKIKKFGKSAGQLGFVNCFDHLHFKLSFLL